MPVRQGLVIGIRSGVGLGFVTFLVVFVASSARLADLTRFGGDPRRAHMQLPAGMLQLCSRSRNLPETEFFGVLNID